MLSRREKEYLENIETFEDKYGLAYAQVVRNRIRKRCKQAIEDLSLVVKKDGAGRKVSKALRQRMNTQFMKDIKEGKIPQEEIAGEFAIANFRALLCRGREGRKENAMFCCDFEQLVYMIAKKDTWMQSRMIEAIYSAKSSIIKENREALLQEYHNFWHTYGDEWLKERLSSYPYTWKCRDADFKDVEECIQWLKDRPL